MGLQLHLHFFPFFVTPFLVRSSICQKIEGQKMDIWEITLLHLYKSSLVVSLARLGKTAQLTAFHKWSKGLNYGLGVAASES